MKNFLLIFMCLLINLSSFFALLAIIANASIPSWLDTSTGIATVLVAYFFSITSFFLIKKNDSSVVDIDEFEVVETEKQNMFISDSSSKQETNVLEEKEEKEENKAIETLEEKELIPEEQDEVSNDIPTTEEIKEENDPLVVQLSFDLTSEDLKIVEDFSSVGQADETHH